MKHELKSSDFEKMDNLFLSPVLSKKYKIYLINLRSTTIPSNATSYRYHQKNYM